MTYIIEGALVNEKGEEQPLKAGDFALVNPDEKHQYRNKGDKPFKMICGVPKEFEWAVVGYMRVQSNVSLFVSIVSNSWNNQDNNPVFIDYIDDPVFSVNLSWPVSS